MTSLYLDRPDALNAQDLPLIERLTRQLEKTDMPITLLAKGKHFSVGGDVKSILQGHQQDSRFCRHYFTQKYALDRLWQQLPDTTTVIQGYCLGGGLGLAVGSRRIHAYGDAVLAMPEVYIGMVPDCGMVVELIDKLGPLGELMLLTGLRLSGAQAYQVGLVDDLLDDQPLPDMSTWQQQSEQWVKQPLTQRWQTLPSFVDLPSPVSMLAVVATYRHIKLYAHRSRTEAMAVEVNLAHNLMVEGEFSEGIQARLLDKRAPRFLYPEVRSVPPQMIDRLYAGS